MNSRIISGFFIITISLFLRNTNASLCQQTIEYIDGQLRNTKVEIAKNYIQDPDPDRRVTYDPKWVTLWTRYVDPQSSPIALSNKLFILLKTDTLMSIDISLHPPDLFPSTICLQKVSLAHSTPLSFLKSITYKNLLYLLTCSSSNFCNIYTHTSTQQFLHHQRTRYDQSRPMAASFFTNNDQLYLVISTILNTYPSPSVIYRWTGTYMDEITRISLESVTSVVTFTHKSSTFLVFSQSYLGSKIYKLIIDESSGKGHLDLTQFLQTNAPVGMLLYPHNGCTFLLVVNEAEPSQVFWWDGTEFLPWMQLEDIQGSRIINSIRMGNDTLFFTARGNLLTLYKVESLQYERLSTFYLPDAVRIIDLGVWIDGENISVVLISEKGPNCYRVEPLQLFINKLKKGEVKTIDDNSEEKSKICLEKLREKVVKRMGEVEVSRGMWKDLHSASGDAVVDTIEADVVIRSGQGVSSIENLEIINNGEDIISPAELRILVEDLDSKIAKSLNKSQNLVKIDGTKTIVLPSLIITDEAIFDDLETFSLETRTINDEDLDKYFSNAISSTSDQVFGETLRGDNVTIYNLEVESLCGVPREFWLLKNESKKTPLKPISGPADLQIQMEINNDTVFMTSDIFLPKLEAHVLNSVDLKNFLDNLFVIGQNQVINGDVVFEHLSVDDLILKRLNGAPAEELLTMTTDQYVNHSVFIDSLDVRHLWVNKINGIRISEAARVSKENIIKGKVVVSHLKIADELIVNDDCDLFKNGEHVQVYEEVTIIGSVTMRKLMMEGQADVQLEGLSIRGNDVERLFAKSWTKSSDQVVNPSVTFENGVTVDEFNAEYLNGIKENDYLYTTVEKINSEFGKIHFGEVFVNGSLRHGNQKDFVEVSEDTLVFNERVFFRELNSSNIITSRYNGIPVYMINDSRGAEPVDVSLPEDLVFDKIVVRENLQVNDLHLETLNGRNVSKFLFVDQNHRVESVKTKEFRVSEFRSSSSSKVPRAASEFLPSRVMDIIIQGPLIIEEDLHIEKSINDQSVDHYLDHLSKSDIRVNDPDLVLKELNVLEDVTISSIHKVDFDKFVKSIFSKNKEQILTGTKSFHRVDAKNVEAVVINGKMIEEMYFINDSLVFEGDVTFTNLSADVEALTLNNVDTKWIQNDLSYILSKNITIMNLTGSVSWESSKSPKILSDLINNAVNNNKTEIIETPVDFSEVETIKIVSLYTENSPFSKISDIIKDAVVNNDSMIEFTGTKTFLQDIEVLELIVDDLQVDLLEKTTIKDLNASIVRKFEDIKMINGTCTFTDEVSMIHLETPDLGPGMPNISSLFVSSDKDHHLPSGTHFNKLMIREAEVFSLDGVNFGEFLEKRMTLTGDYVVQSNVRFNGHIHVSGDVEVKKINGIDVNDIVLKDSVQPQVLQGTKKFSEDLIVEMDVRAPLFNEVNIIDSYNNGVVNEESAVIRGNLIIEGNIKLSKDTKVSGRINGLKLNSILQDYGQTSDEDLEMIRRNVTAINALINSTKISGGRLPRLFQYFEVHQELETPGLQTFKKTIPVVIQGKTQLHVYGTQSGENCPSLPEDCPCRSQYIIELSEDLFVSKKEDNSFIFNIQVINNLLTIHVGTTTISSSSRCTSHPGINEYTTISWMSRDNSSVAGALNHHGLKISGYLSDVQVFVHMDAAYVVLVMSYDVESRTHAVDSLIYELDLQKNELNLKLRADVRGASAVEVFWVPGRGSHVLIGAGGDGDRQETAKSVLYRVEVNGSEFGVLRSFYSGGTSRVKSLAYRDEDFVVLDDVRMKAVHVYGYRESFDNFYLYQSFYFECAVNGVEAFYAGEVRWSDAYLVISTEEDRVFLYRFMMVGRFQEVMSKAVQGALGVSPVRVDEEGYLLVIRSGNSNVYRIVSQG